MTPDHGDVQKEVVQQQSEAPYANATSQKVSTLMLLPLLFFNKFMLCLTNTETLDDKIQHAYKLGKPTKGSSSKKSLTGKAKNDDHYATDIDEASASGDFYYGSDEIESPDSHVQPQKSDRTKHKASTKKTSANSVTSTDSSGSNPRSLTKHDRNEANRIRDADDRHLSGSSSSKKLAQYKQQLDALTKANQLKDQQLEELESNLDQMNNKFDDVTSKYSKATGFLQAIRQKSYLDHQDF